MCGLRYACTRPAAAQPSGRTDLTRHSGWLAGWRTVRASRACPPCGVYPDGAGAQKTLDAAGRRASAASAYVLEERLAPRLSGRVAVLTDDLFTTGATLFRLAALARSAGASGVLLPRWQGRGNGTTAPTDAGGMTSARQLTNF